MQWTKVTSKYAELIFADASDSVFRTYIRVMLLVSSMEFAPNLNQLSTKLGRRKVQSLMKYIEGKQNELGSDVISLDIIIQKVMEDVDAVKRVRDGNKVRKRRERETNVTRDVTSQIRGDKIRGDKIRVNKEEKKEKEHLIEKKFEEIYNQYPKRIKRKESFRYFKGSVLNEGDFAQIQIALANYLECKEVKEGYVQNASTWFNNWGDWVVDPNADTNALKNKTKEIDKKVERMLNATSTTNL